METSTPLVSRQSLHRIALMKNAGESSPLRRRSIVPSPVVAVEKSNDDNERSTRRSVADMQRRISNIPQAASPLNESAKFLGEQDMKDHFQICTKLFSENKINNKNAWRLHIIDILRTISQKSNTDTLQLASASLDISAKVYSVRVDDVHAEGLKLASSMARVAEKQPPPQDLGENMDENLEEGGNKEKTTKKKSRKKRLAAGEKNTVSKDPQSLLGPLPKLESVLFSTRMNADASAVDNLFTNVLRMDNSGYKFMLMSKEAAWTTKSDPVLASLKDPQRKRCSLSVLEISNLRLCEPFKDFSVDEWDLDAEEKQLASEKSSLLHKENEVMFDDNGIPIPELDGSIHDIFSNENNGDDNMMDMDGGDQSDDQPEEFCAQIRGEVNQIVDFRPDDTQPRSEYSYNAIVNTHSGHFVDQIWAGPSHWKLKFIRRSSLKFTGSVVEKKVTRQTRKKASVEVLDFNSDTDEIDLTKKTKIKRKLHTDPIKTLPISESSNLKIWELLNQSMSKPGTGPVKKMQVTREVEYEIGGYNYENPNDSQYCTQHNDADDVPTDDPFDCDQEESAEVAAQQNFLGENLVDVPELVPKSYVPYALLAKKMNMKKLKAAVWQNLTKQDNVSEKEVLPGEVQVIPTTFSKLFSEIPKLISEKMRSELSSPLAFMALLHVCNEQNLELVQHPGYKDFDIRGPPL